MTVPVSGLHCKACEILTADALTEIKNVERVTVSHKSGEAEIFYEGEEPDLKEIKIRLETAGYSLGKTTEKNNREKKLNDNSEHGASFSNGVTLVSSVLVLFWALSKINFDPSGWLNQDFSLPLAILVGLIAGASTCLALVGGLVMGLAANYAKDHPEASRRQKFRPHLLFNAGRIIGFFILGGLLGSLGEVFKLSAFANSLITIFVGLMILILGLKLLNIFPALNRLDFSLPKNWAKVIKINNPLWLGALTFFMPCGFTQAMQLYALNAGGFLSGGLIMALFALGTAPGLLGIGGLSSLLNRRKSLNFFKAAGIIIIVFGLFNLSNGYKLLKISAGADAGIKKELNIQDNSKNSVKTKDPVGQTEENVQIIRMTENSRGYSPNKFTIIKDKPVRWIITAEAPYSCASALIVPSLNIQKQLERGENIVEFTPTKIGNIPFSCSMGMYTGNFQVVEK